VIGADSSPGWVGWQAAATDRPNCWHLIEVEGQRVLVASVSFDSPADEGHRERLSACLLPAPLAAYHRCSPSFERLA
jgi:hypothetical protein